MAFFDIFRQKTKHSAGEIAKGIAAGINEQLSEISCQLSEQDERLRRIESKQKETVLQLEEIDDLLQSGGNESSFINALISLADIIYDFYYFACQKDDTDTGPPLFEQARMMWNTAKNTVESAGLEIIDAANEPFDFRLHSAESTEQDNSFPEGYVTKILKCGYIHKGEIIRRALVVINKFDKIGEREEIEELEKIENDNIIIFPGEGNV